MDSVVMLTCDFNPSLAEYSVAALESLKKTDGEFEQIVVDNGSKYGAGQVRGYADIYIRNKENIGYPGAVNQGVALSNGEFVTIANNDIRVSPNWMKVAREILENPKVGSVHFRMIPYDEEIVPGNETWLTGRERWCSSSFFVLRRKAFDEVGGYDLGYKEGGYDDWDFWHRVRHVKGWITAYTNKAVYQHQDSSTYMALDDGVNRSERDMRNMERFREKFGKYAEEIWREKYPEQMTAFWKPFP